jgi:methylmalonyl-CoA mutase cobalamin-binding domain/chain
LSGTPVEDGAAVGQSRLNRLVRTIEAEIVPRLVLTRRVKLDTAAVNVPQSHLPDGVDLVDVKELVRLLLAHEAVVACAFVETVRQRGATLEMVCLDLLAPAAAELGLLWEEDECDFMQVTVGLCRLHQVLRELTPEFAAEDAGRDGNQRVLLAAYPGEQHTFGVTLVAQFLRRAGWDVWHEFPKTTAELLDLTRDISFSVVGLSMGSATRMDGVPETIRSLRKVSRNRHIGVMIGGAMFVANPQLAVSMGADATATDGRDAVQQAERLREAGCRREASVRRL